MYTEKIKMRKRVNIYNDILRGYESEKYDCTYPVFSVVVYTAMDGCTLYLIYTEHGQF